mmetsp:Transcript_24693/g.68717  ORF Transcript_24693/g.68717 Transcript_24693/m.68717 type:complete len:363 (+) Transcript_24693:397-1485(+)
MSRRRGTGSPHAPYINPSDARARRDSSFSHGGPKLSTCNTGGALNQLSRRQEKGELHNGEQARAVDLKHGFCRQLDGKAGRKEGSGEEKGGEGMVEGEEANGQRHRDGTKGALGEGGIDIRSFESRQKRHRSGLSWRLQGDHRGPPCCCLQRRGGGVSLGHLGVAKVVDGDDVGARLHCNAHYTPALPQVDALLVGLHDEHLSDTAHRHRHPPLLEELQDVGFGGGQAADPGEEVVIARDPEQDRGSNATDALSKEALIDGAHGDDGAQRESAVWKLCQDVAFLLVDASVEHIAEVEVLAPGSHDVAIQEWLPSHGRRHGQRGSKQDGEGRQAAVPPAHQRHDQQQWDPRDVEREGDDGHQP